MANVVGALCYLKVVSLGNALRSRLVRLKQPKYLVGALVGGAYLFLVFAGPGGRNERVSFDAGLPDGVLASADALAALGLTIVMLLYWIVPRGRASLAFTEPEIAFLFSAPLSRRALIHYRLVSSQVAILLTVVILTFFSRGLTFVAAGALERFVGFWIIFATVGLHGLGASFVITRWFDRGLTPLRRLLVAPAILAVVAAFVVLWVRNSARAPDAADLASIGAFAAHLTAVLNAPPWSYLIAPAMWVVRPLFAGDGRSFLLALGPALLLYAAHYLWVLRMNVSFEEQSIERAAKRAAQMAAFRETGTFSFRRAGQRARREPFALAAHGRPEIAFLWKNLLSTADILRPRSALVAAAIIVAAGFWLMSNPELAAVRLTIGRGAALIAVYVLFFGPLVARQDLRRDLRNADLLKTYPLGARQIVLGEMLAPIAILTVLLWLLLLTAAFVFPAGGAAAAGIFGLALNAPFVIALQLFVANATVLLFPAWFAPSRQESPSGIEGFGQRLVAIWGQVLLTLLALIPAAIAAIALFLLASWLMGPAAGVVFAAVAIAAVLAGELAAGIWWLGKRFERFDLSAELRA